MLFLALSLVAQAAEPTTPPTRERVLVLDLQAGGGVDPQQAKLINELVTESMSHFAKYEVMSSADVRQLVTVEAEKHATGCDDSSCLAEIAGAMGARWVVFGTIGKLGTLTVLTLSLFDQREAKPVGRQRVQARDIETLPTEIDRALALLIGEEPPAAEPAPEVENKGISPLVIGGGAAAGVGVVGAVILGSIAAVLDDGLGKVETPSNDKETALTVGPWVIAGAAASSVLAIAGGGVLAAGMVLE